MKKRIRLIAVVTVVALLAAGWTWRYVTMNRYYDDLNNGDYKLYQAGEPVPFEDDGNDKDTNLNGYSIRVDGYEVRDYDDYLTAAQITPPQDENDPEKIALVYVTLINESCQGGGVTLTDFKLRGIDSAIPMDWDVLLLANSVLQGNTGITLATQSECALVLPFMLKEEAFSRGTWNKIEDYKVYLQVTSSFTTKEILVNG